MLAKYFALIVWLGRIKVVDRIRGVSFGGQWHCNFFFAAVVREPSPILNIFFKILSNIKGLLKYFVITFRGAGVKSKYYN